MVEQTDSKCSDGAKLSDYSNTISYKAIPYPVPEVFRKELIAAGRISGGSPDGDIAAIIRIEGTLRKLYGIKTTRPTMGKWR